MSYNIPPRAKSALDRLLAIAQRDTHQSNHVADFLLAWWNATENGGFDLVDLWAVDAEIALDMIQIFALVYESRRYPDSLGYKKEFEAIWERWRAPLQAKWLERRRKAGDYIESRSSRAGGAA